MSFSQYIKRLLPSFETSRLKQTLSAVCEEIETLLAPTVEKLKPIFPANWHWRNNTVKHLMEEIHRGVKIRKVAPANNAIVLISYTLQNMLTILPFIKGEVDKAFGREIASAGLTFNKTTLIQFAEMAEFTVRYTQRLLNYVTAAELTSINGTQQITGIGPDDETWLKANLPTYMTALRVMSTELAELKKDMQGVPDMVVEESTEQEVKVVVGHHNVDPLGFASVPFPLSFIFNIRLAIADWQVNRYETAVAESKVVEYRILLMKQQLEEGHGDAAMERLLQVSEDRLMKLRYKISKMEEAYELN